MKRLLIVLLLAGCTQKQTITPKPVETHTTVYRFTSHSCDAPPESKRLRDALNDAARWKKYAESLEKLPSAKVTPNEAHP